MRATSFFIDTPGSVPPEPRAPFWGARAESGPLEGGSVETCFSVAHDPERLYLVVRCEEPKMAALWVRRKSGQPYLELDDSVEFNFTPAPHAEAGSGPRAAAEGSLTWRLVVAASGAWGWSLPDEVTPPPETDVRIERLKRSWLVFVGFPVPDLAVAGALRGTPLDGEEWDLSVRRFRRYSPPSYEREVAELKGKLSFEGGRPVSPVHLARAFEGGFGVNEIRLSFGGPIPDGIDVKLSPPPAEKLRAKDLSRFKCRIARAGGYRLRLWLPEARKDDPLLRQYCAGLSFTLEDRWAELEEMESRVGDLKERLGGTEEGYSDELKRLLMFFEGSIIQLDRYRAPYVKERLTRDSVEATRATFAEARGALRKALIDRDELRAVSPYAKRGNWYKGLLHVRTDHSGGAGKPAQIVKQLKEKGYSFVGFADPPHGGDQDGDGKHNWKRSGRASKKAKRFKAKDGRKLVVPADRGREAYVRDYSRTAGAQGLKWVKDKWKLSVPGEFAVLSGVEVGAYARVSCYGLPPGAVSNSYSEMERARFSVLATPDCQLVPLPEELKGVHAVENDDLLWERHLTRGAGLHFVLAPDGDPAESGRTMDVCVLAKELTEEAILESLAAGSFYTTSGPRIKSVRAEGASVTVEVEEPCHILFVGAGGEILGGEAEATSFTYTFEGREKYVRAVCLEDVEEDGFKRAAYTQAFYLSDEFPRR